MTTESMTGHDIVDLDARVVRGTVALVSQAGPADLARPTPCAGWTLGDLIGHMTTQHYGWTAAAAGHGADLSSWQPGPPAADPVGDWCRSRRACASPRRPACWTRSSRCWAGAPPGQSYGRAMRLP